MMMEFPFHHDDYRSLLKELIKSRKIKSSSICQSIGMQASHFSRVMNGELHLKDDHLYLIAADLDLDHIQLKYIETLFKINRTEVEQRKEILKSELTKLRNELSNTKRVIDSDSLDESVTSSKQGATVKYYTDPRYIIIHMFLMTQWTQESLDQLMNSLRVDELDFKIIIDDLQRLELISVDRFKPLELRVLKNSLHLDKRSPLQNIYIPSVRMKSLERIFQIPKEDRQSLSVTLAISEKTESQIKEKIVNLLGELKSLCQTSEPEKVYQFNLDFFPWID